MSEVHQKTKTPRIRGAVILALISLVITNLACGYPFGGNPTPRSHEAVPTPSLPPLPTATPEPLPPGLVESDPPINAELPLNGPITLFFNQPMDRTTVEAALTSQFQQKLSFTWVDDTTVVVYLTDDLSPDTALAFELDQSIRSRQGLSLSQPVSFNFRTAGYLQLVQNLPEDGAVEVDPTSAIVASFNRPIVPLGADPATLPAGFTLEPTAEGRGEWLNTSTYIFYPEPALSGGVTYTVQINPSLKSTDGAPQKDTFSWAFSTALPKLISVEPSTETPWQLNPEVRLTFNQPMDRQDVEAHFSMRFPDGRPIEGEFTWQDDDTLMSFVPKDLLPRNTSINLVLDAQAKSVGGSPLGDTFSALVVTMPELSVSRSEPAEGGELEAHAGVSLIFTSLLPANQDIKPFVEVEPLVADLQLTVDETTLSLWGTFTPSTNYRVRISPELKDTWGGLLGKEFVLEFHTAALPPNVSFPTGADAIFLTPQDLSLVVQAVNVSQVPLTVGSVPLPDLFRLLGPNGYEFRRTYQSADQVSFTQPLNLPPDQMKNVPLYLSPDQRSLKQGVYFVRLDFPQSETENISNIYPGPYLIVVSNIQLTLKLSATDALVWAVDLRTGELAANAPIILFDESGTMIASGQTDAAGVFTASFAARSDPYSLVYAVMSQAEQENFGMTFANWTGGIEPWSFDITYNLQPPGPFLYFYTDRPIYRPGDTVYFRAVARQTFNGRYFPTEISKLPVTIYGAEGRELATMELPVNAFGTAHGQFNLPEDAQPGYYSISSSAGANSYLGFQVASYRKPEINLSVNFSKDQVKAGDPINAQVEARYFFDAPAGNLSVHWALYKSQNSFYLSGYQVGSENLDWLQAYRLPDFSSQLGTLIQEGNSQTSPEGTLGLNFPTEITDTPQRYTLEVTIQDDSELPVSNRGSVQVHPDDFYIGIRPDVWVAKAGEPIGFDIQTVNWEKAPTPEISLRGEFQRVTFERGNQPSGDPFQLPLITPVYTAIGSVDFMTGDDGLARLSFTPPDPGTYLLDVFNSKTSKGEGSRTQILLWVGGQGQAIWPNLPNSRLRLISDKNSYQPGETAQVFIPNPYGKKITALLTIERSVIMDHQVVQIGPEGYLFDVPLSDNEAPNIFVSAILVGEDEQGQPDFRAGFINLSVTPVHQTLNVQLLSEPQRAGPGDEIQFELLVTDSNGEPVQGEFSLSIVDLAVLALTEPNSKGILQSFYGEQPLGVQTSLSLAVYNRRLVELPLGIGGGGGEEALGVAREHFPDTAYWNAEVLTGSDGRAIVKMNLPDTLTTWQVDARGLTQDTKVGEAETQLVSTKELLVRPVTPRFLVAQDHIEISAVVQNNTNDAIQAEVTVQPNGMVLDEPAQQSQQVNLPANSHVRVKWWGVVQDTDTVNLLFSAEGRDSQGKLLVDATRPATGSIPVKRYVTPQSYRTAGILETNGQVQELISLPRSFSPSGGELKVELSPSLSAAMIAALDALESAPFASTEQILSSFLPNLEIYHTHQDFGIDNQSLKNHLDRALNENLVQLLARQNFDGGWSWWGEGPSDPYISAYVLFGLQRARLAGVSINQNVLDQCVSYLKTAAPNYLPSDDPNPSSSNQEADGKTGWPEKTWEWDRQAFQQFSLAQLESADTAVIEQIYQNRDKLSPWAQSLLALTFEKQSLGSDQAQVLLTSLEGEAVRTATGAYWELGQDSQDLGPVNNNMQSNLSNTAIVLFALAQRSPASPLVADTVRFLMSNRTADSAWVTSYTTAWTLIALDQVLKGTGELGGSFRFGASINNNPIADGKVDGIDQLTSISTQIPVQRLYADYPNVLKIDHSDGNGRLYYTAGLSINQPVEKITPLSKGVTIQREVFPFGTSCGEAPCSPIESAKAGQKVSVRLTLTLPYDMYYLAVTDNIPSGAEILDTSLKTSQQGLVGGGLSAQAIYDPRHPFAEGWGWWLFNQPRIFDDHIAWTADQLPAGTYELTYTLVLLQPGNFRVLPARAWSIYFPEIQGNSAGSQFTIEP